MTIYAELIKFAHMNNRVSPLCYQYRERQKKLCFSALDIPGKHPMHNKYSDKYG